MGNSVSKSGDFLIAISVEDSIQLSIRLRLAVQSALLDAVPAALREVSCGWEGTEIKLRFAFDGKNKTSLCF
jgi:hypothetical protein